MKLFGFNIQRIKNIKNVVTGSEAQKVAQHPVIAVGERTTYNNAKIEVRTSEEKNLCEIW